VPELPTFIQQHVRISELVLTLVHPLLDIPGLFRVLNWGFHRLYLRSCHHIDIRQILRSIYASLFLFVLIEAVWLGMYVSIWVLAV